MGFDDFFEHDQRKYKHDQGHHNKHNSIHNQSKHSIDFELIKGLISKNLNDPNLRWLIILAIVIILAILALAIILLLPLAIKLFDFIAANGIQGLIDSLGEGNK
jgi:hypothetical protein